ncbi:uncharacterized protein N7443_009493 [Penicillium atrosanguineum]|uniref:uncharacterized protein n=1 Tax=Penicillium atrosanguineum TaxID=1132637 RepID=UPI00239EBB58|nr:uncharacterized protein N7443_009493 [Penicillium atrosanguineum]KAJ5293540.1 hypothetical protein N7443_009493 [Penicillium atrosanguineum]
MTFVRDLRQRERRFQTIDQQRNALTCTGIDTYEGTRPWLERTRWISTYQGIPRDILKRMMLLPASSSIEPGLKLGSYQDEAFMSPPADEDQIYRLVSALDLVLDRCEETMQHTGQPILAWLKSHIAAEASPRPFSFLGTRQSRSRYRRTWKQFVTFILRAFRLGPLACQELLRLKFPLQLFHVLEQIWANSLQAVAKDLSSRRLSTEAVSSLEATANATDDEISREVYNEDSADGLSVSWSDKDEESGSLNTLLPCVPISSSLQALPDHLIESLFNLCVLLITQEFTDGNPQASVLVYFSGVLGISSNGAHFLPAKLFTPYLSALIYIQRLLFLEYALPYREYPYLNWPSRPRTDHLTRLQNVRKQYMLPGSLTALGEFQSLRAFGKRQAALDPPSFFHHWSSDGNTVSLENVSVTLSSFRALPAYFIRQSHELCDTLLLGLSPAVDLSAIYDPMVNNQPGQSFVSYPANHLRDQYLQLADQAAGESNFGLIQEGAWHLDAVHRYLLYHDQLLGNISGIFITAGGQMPRLKELEEIEYTNSASSERAIYVYRSQVIYLTRHSKSKRSTGREFIVARFLPPCAGHILFLYLVYIRPFAELLCREQNASSTALRPTDSFLFRSLVSGKRWQPSHFHQILTDATSKVWYHRVHPRWYRQISIAVAEKHVQTASRCLNRFDDKSAQANPDVVFAWQSGHRPLQRAQTYGLDGAFPTKLQPALLRVYETASHAWHDFLYPQSRGTVQRSKTVSVPTIELNIPPPQSAECLAKRSLDSLLTLPVAKRQRPSSPELIPLPVAESHRWLPYLRMLSECRVVLCTVYGGCYTRCNLSRHLLEGHQVQFAHRRRILASPLLEGSAFADTLANVVHPSDGVAEIAGLPSQVGFICHTDECQFRSSSQERMRQHYNSMHQWRVRTMGPIPWRQAYLQTLFQQKQNIKYFTVMKSIGAVKLCDVTDGGIGMETGE